MHSEALESLLLIPFEKWYLFTPCIFPFNGFVWSMEIYSGNIDGISLLLIWHIRNHGKIVRSKKITFLGIYVWYIYLHSFGCMCCNIFGIVFCVDPSVFHLNLYSEWLTWKCSKNIEIIFKVVCFNKDNAFIY